PASAIRSVSETWHSWEEIRSWRVEIRQRAQLSPSHTFSRLPGFFPRPAEAQAVELALEEEPCFTVLFGGSSVGKTALLRQILCSDNYHVLHFDLRIAGFADLDSLYISLSKQMEQYFLDVSKGTGYADFEKEAWRYKHDRIDLERRNPDVIGRVRTSDIARLMEIFQARCHSSLLKYREFDPSVEPEREESAPRRSWSLFRRRRSEHRPKWRSWFSKAAGRTVKKQVVFFLDEAHKMWAFLVLESKDTMKVLLDSMLILTKQDRLCHVIHSTSDPFYQTWLREQNIMQHCKFITIGDCSKSETERFFKEKMLPRVPELLQYNLNFDRLYNAFGGRLVHWQDYITDYENTLGRLQIQHSSHFTQAHALLNISLIHSSTSSELTKGLKRRRISRLPGVYISRSALDTSPRQLPAVPTHSKYHYAFTALQLLSIMVRLTQPGVRALSYFALCREFGPDPVDGMVRVRILDLRWTDPVTRESDDGVLGIGGDEDGVVGPTLVPATPIMRHAMRTVVEEYRDTIQEYCEQDIHDACPPDFHTT
ncbi:hypothetical protein BV25DRAFT_1812636, partial [Artomyces pyxidatus]